MKTATKTEKYLMIVIILWLLEKTLRMILIATFVSIFFYITYIDFEYSKAFSRIRSNAL